jgi:hypothetical protein
MSSLTFRTLEQSLQAPLYLLFWYLRCCSCRLLGGCDFTMMVLRDVVGAGAGGDAVSEYVEATGTAVQYLPPEIVVMR